MKFRSETSLTQDIQNIFSEIRRLRRELKTGKRKLLSVNETAAYLGISPKTIRNKISDGTFPIKPVRLSGRVLFRIDDLDLLVDGLGGTE
jgi:excisionase family DNA binding protein